MPTRSLVKSPTRPLPKRALRTAVLASLREQGFTLRGGAIQAPLQIDKDGLRALHGAAVAHQIAKAKRGLARHEPRLLGHLADGATPRPERIEPRLVPVARHSEEELLFRWARLHWSIPTSAGYGRRLRFVVIDAHNDKLMGLIGLGDPVIALGPRDRWIGWEAPARHARLRNAMDAFVLGAVPPYSFLLAGKLVALMARSAQVGAAFADRYAGRAGLISGATHDGELALITTTSALGRSSMYNRLRGFHAVGFTRGSGEFQFAGDLYDALSDCAAAHCQPTAKAEAWGAGFRNRRELVKKALEHLGLGEIWLYHGILREIFCAPLATNAPAFLRGEDAELAPNAATADELTAYWRERWLLPRARREQRHLQWTPECWRLWPVRRV